MARMEMGDILFVYRDGPPQLCYVVPSLFDDEIEVVVDEVQRRCEDRETGAYKVYFRPDHDHAPLEGVRRKRTGDWSSHAGMTNQRAAELLAIPEEARTEEQQRRLDVWCEARALREEICRLRHELKCDDPHPQSILTVESRENVLQHLAEIACTPPELPFLTEETNEEGEETKEAASEPDAIESTHSDDFTSVNWYETRYSFSKGNQAEAVRALWEAWESGGHSLSQESIGEKIGSTATRFELRKTFRSRAKGGYVQHPAWGTMIKEDHKGTYRLVPPTSP